MLARRAGMLAIAGSVWVASRSWAADTGWRRIGVLCPDWENLDYFVRALRDAGYQDGRNAQLIFKRWLASPDELDALAAELVAARVHVIAASSTPEIKAAKRATRTIPIVMMYGLAPVELGLVASLARPGGNVTGTVAIPREMMAKTLDLFVEAIPSMRRIAVLVDLDPSAKVYLFDAAGLAKARGIALTPLQIGSASDLSSAFSELQRSLPDGVLVGQGLVPFEREIIGFAAQQRLPTMFGDVASAHNRGLMAYGPDLTAVYRRAAAIVAKVLNGVRPQDIPVEEPTRFVLAINRLTASKLGVQFPQSVLARVDRTFD